MAAHRNPRWSTSELAILREHYPLGGLKATIAMLPGRSWHSIYMKAAGHGLKAPKPDAPRCALAGEKLEQAIRLREEGWSFAKIGAHLGVAESSACNAVLAALCVRQGFTPIERGPNGRMTDAGKERLRWMLKKGLKGVEIQLRTGLSASRIAEERRRYNTELKANGKALLPPPGNGEHYSGVRISAEAKREAERLFLEGYGTAKVAQKSGVSKTVATRIRNKLIARLKRKGQRLPGCDANGKRRQTRDHSRHVPDALKARLRELILARVPVRRAAAICGIGSCSAYRLRDQMKAEGIDIPAPRLPGKTRPLQREMLYAQAIPDGQLWRFRELVREIGDMDRARAALRAEMAEASRTLTFEDRLALVANGRRKIVAVPRLSPADPQMTLGGVATGAL